MSNKITYHIKTFGCQMNKSDSERIRSVMDNAGFKFVSEDKASVLIAVACSVRQSAIDRIWGIINKQKTVNKKQKNQILIITGCLLPNEKNKFSDRADLIVDIQNIQELPAQINKPLGYGSTIKKISNATRGSYFQIQPSYSNNFSAYVPIMTGCDNYCSYCAVPYARGRELSRPVDEILNEVSNLVVRGVREIILLGQNVNSYKSSIDFPTLLREVNSIGGNFWIRFVTSHPKDLSDDLIRVLIECEKVTEYLHLPAQSGDDEILKKMNRKYTIDHYKTLIKKIRSSYAKKNIEPCVSTDIIVGFPGETRQQFQNTISLFEDIKYDMAYISQYSPRPGTVAANSEDNVPKEEKKERKKVLTRILEKTALENNQKIIGQRVDVLVENCKNNICMGKTRNFKNIKFEGSNNLVGEIIGVKILEADSWGFKGGF